MKLMQQWGILSLILVLWPGCRGTEAPAAPASASKSASLSNAVASAVQQAAQSAKAQAKLPTIKLWLGAEEIVAEQALTEAQWATGMMARTEMKEDEGMLFVFPVAHRASFYMKNTPLPLAGAYIDPDGVIQEIIDMKPLDETPLPAASDNIQYVLEMNKDWFARHNIGVGTVLRTERGSLRETYFRRR